MSKSGAAAGLSVPEFIGRIADAENIADDWPFAATHPDTAYEAKGSALISDSTPSGTLLTTLEPVYAESATPDEPAWVRLARYNHFPGQLGTYNVDVAVEDDQVGTWSQMLGVRLAVELVLGRPRQSSVNTRMGRLDRILGIEQPLRTQPEMRLPRSGNRDSGYIHGEVLRVDRADISPHDYEALVCLGRESTARTLECRFLTVRSAPGADFVPVLQPDDLIRTRVRRSPGDWYTFIGEGSPQTQMAYLLRRGEQPAPQRSEDE